MKSHFKFTQGQRNGIFLLVALILLFQCLYFFIDFSSKDISVNTADLERFEQEMDSLRLVEVENNKPKIYPFNPNYITDYKGYTLGMSNSEIDRLLAFRKQDRWVNSAIQFQQVTKVSDSFLKTISPYFKFPEWVTHPRPKTSVSYQFSTNPKSFKEKIDLNTATAVQLRRVNGIGEKLSARIIKFRSSFQGGFIADVQLQDVYGLSPEVMERINQQFTVKTPRVFVKFNLNEVTTDELVTIQHIDYELAYEIVEQRTLRESYKSLEELSKVKGFPIDKIEIIKLYLFLQ